MLIVFSATVLALHKPVLVPRAQLSLRAQLRASVFLQHGDELDALDTSDDWEAQLAEMRAWEASQKSTAPSAGSDGVDEEAHLGLGPDDDEETPEARSVRQLAEKQAAVLLSQIENSKGGAPADKRVMTSLEAVLGALGRLEDKVDSLNSKVEQLQVALKARSMGCFPGGKL